MRICGITPFPKKISKIDKVVWHVACVSPAIPCVMSVVSDGRQVSAERH